MTDAEYEKQRTRIEKLIVKWADIFQLTWHNVDFVYRRSLHPTVPDRGAETDSSWQYRSATITFYLPRAINAIDKDVEMMVIHEFCHIVLSPMTQAMVDNTEFEMEFATESMARVIYNAKRRSFSKLK